MGLMDALRSAQGQLATNAARSAIVAANVGRAGEEGYARREAPTTTDLTGARLTRVRRAHDGALEASHLAARSAAAEAAARAAATERLAALHGPDGALAPHALIADLKTAMQRLAADPGSGVAAASAVERARELAGGLNAIGNEAAAMRAEADAALADHVAELDGLLVRFGDANAAVVVASRTGADGSDAADARARALAGIADLIGVEVRTRAHDDVVLIARGTGAVLFETLPRPVAFAPSGALAGAGGGSPVTVDGQALGPGAGGRIGAALAVRDRLVPDIAARADALAAGLIEAFADGAAPGLFAAAAPGLPGLAARVAVSPAYDPEAGGDPFALRDGANAARNPGREASFADLLIERIEAIDAPRGFDPALGLGDPASLASAAAAHRGQLDRARSEADGARAGTAATLERAHAAHANAVGVNVDEEMARLIEIEQSHRAAARIVAVVDAMLDDLFRAVG